MQFSLLGDDISGVMWTIIMIMQNHSIFMQKMKV